MPANNDDVISLPREKYEELIASSSKLAELETLKEKISSSQTENDQNKQRIAQLEEELGNVKNSNTELSKYFDSQIEEKLKTLTEEQRTTVGELFPDRLQGKTGLDIITKYIGSLRVDTPKGPNIKNDDTPPNPKDETGSPPKKLTIDELKRTSWTEIK